MNYLEARAKCYRKKAFATARDAKDLVAALKRKQNYDKTLMAFKCDFCNLWHVGHRRKHKEVL